MWYRRSIPLVLFIGLTTAVFNNASTWAEDPAQLATEDLPPGELGKVIALGREMVVNTGEHPLSRPYVKNALTCRSCHLDAGTHPEAGTFLGVATAYPAWSPREKRVITLEDRVLNCFMRSMNGVRPPNGSEVSVAVTAYITWLSQGEALEMNASAPLGPNHLAPLKIALDEADVDEGEALYSDHCALCHRDNGQGNSKNPPVWGDRSYNDGAGLSRNDKLAPWLVVAMPPDDPYLTEKEALDIAAFINSKPRPKFVLQDHLPSPERLGEYNAER